MLKVFNTLTRKVEEFVPLNPPKAGIYTCGPTVYDYQHIGNWRTFVFEDILRRTLEVGGFEITHIMNATDVGHLTGDTVGHADLGEDRLEKGAKREGKTVWEVAQFYYDDFVQTRNWLNILPPTHFVRATDHISEQIELVRRLFDKGLAYETETGVFFDVAKYPEYGKLGGQKLIDKRVASREEVEEDTSKHNPADFALWLKTVGRWSDHQMRWNSPWGQGFPGWHLECSAMSMKYLGETFDIHTGGVDHIAIHHTNEIAQSEGATGKPFANYWLHGEFLTVDAGRMGKSLGNTYTLHDIKAKGFDPLALRYLYLTAHYRDKLNFTWEALAAAQKALDKLRGQLLTLKEDKSRLALSREKGAKIDEFRRRFTDSINDDLGIPRALAVLWEALKSNVPSKDKYDLAVSFDEVLGLRLAEVSSIQYPVSSGVKELVEEREKLRNEGDFDQADKIRKKIEKMGYLIEDTDQGPKVNPKK